MAYNRRITIDGVYLGEACACPTHLEVKNFYILKFNVC